MNASTRWGLKAGLALAFAAGLFGSDARAQQPLAAPTAPAGSAWYGYVPGRGWVEYAAPASAAAAPGSASASIAPTAPETTAPVAPGWAGYNPAPAWYGYAPASSPFAPAIPAPGQTRIPVGTLRRMAANQFVNRDAPALAYTLNSYREYGTGRQVPLSKPWLPPSP